MHVSMASAALSEVPNIRNNPNPHQRDKCSSITTCSYDRAIHNRPRDENGTAPGGPQCTRHTGGRHAQSSLVLMANFRT